MVQQDSWQRCPQGVVTKMADRLRGQHRRQALAKIGAGCASGALLLMGYVAATEMMSGGGVEEITCNKAASLFTLYHDGRLEPAARERVESHLQRCPNCREQYRQMYPNEADHVKSPSCGTVAALNPPWGPAASGC